MLVEVPSDREEGDEQHLLRLVAKVRLAGTHVAVIVQPSLRKKTPRSLRVHCWNQMQHAPVGFSQTCSCKLGNAVPGCLLTYYTGNSCGIETEPCDHVPTPGGTGRAVSYSLSGALVALCASLSTEGELSSSNSGAATIVVSGTPVSQIDTVPVSTSSSSSAAHVETLVGMGFSTEDAQAALAATGNNVDAAINRLLG
jgi:hypothetical protein